MMPHLWLRFTSRRDALFVVGEMYDYIVDECALKLCSVLLGASKKRGSAEITGEIFMASACFR